jgi:CRISPR system Cascade subunit CasC
MLTELHLLQNFAPSNLNRDDTGSPKDCEFGGYRRARISSQCQKRAIRDLFGTSQLLPEDARGQRTARLAEAIAGHLARAGHALDEATHVATNLVGALGIKMNEKRPTETSYLVFVGPDELARLAELADRHWSALLAGFTPGGDKKARTKPELPKELASEARAALDGHRAADIALFGRMLADLPERNRRDGAAQVAHAISTNRASIEFDFFTAVDDLKDLGRRDEDAGAGMLGTVEFNSACFYRYFNVDTDQLLANLGGDRELAQTTVRAYLQAAIDAVPTGKQNSFAAHQRPSLVFAVVREDGPLSLANAFLNPVVPRGELDLMAASVAAMDGHWGRMTGMYGTAGICFRRICVDPAYADRLTALSGDAVMPVSALVDETLAAAFPA